jgi:hypothetical protein
MDDHSHLDKKGDAETSGLINEGEDGHQRAHLSASERLQEMKRISQLITNVSN